MGSLTVKNGKLKKTPEGKSSFSKTITKMLNGKTTRVGTVVQFKPQNTYTEAQLIAGFCEGKSEVLRAIYLAHYPAVETMVIKNSGTSEEARDLFQEALLVTFQKVSAPDFSLSCQLGSFIHAVAWRLWQKKLRDERPLDLHTTGDVDELEQEDIDLLIRRMQRYKLYEEKFAELSEGCQELLRQFLKGQSTKKVMEHFGFGSIAYTKKRKCLCKSKLMKMVMEDPAYKDLTDND